LVIDLDNTLWRGILGEDGPEGIEMGGSTSGWAYRFLQQALLQLKASGVLLAVSSKNNPEEALKILTDHPDCLLRPEDFAAIELGWGPKSDSIKRMSERLRLGLDAFVFLDDSPFEREEVSKALPQVTVLEFPDDALQLVATLAETLAFDAPRVTKEDHERTASYVAEAKRDALRSEASSPETFYRSLSLQLKLFSAKPAHTERLHQLILKTNQFNLTSERLSMDEFRRLIGRSDALVIGMRVADKFGDSGITGLAIITGVGTDTWTVENFLLSCRVIGRTIENAFVSWLVRRAKAFGAPDVQLRFQPSARNQVAKDFLDRSGLVWDPARLVWNTSTDLASDALAPHFVSIDDQEIPT
jgi:FkbH-like protein